MSSSSALPNSGKSNCAASAMSLETLASIEALKDQMGQLLNSLQKLSERSPQNSKLKDGAKQMNAMLKQLQDMFDRPLPALCTEQY